MSKKEKFARFGIATKGFVYVLIGGLAVMAAFGIGGETTGSSGVLDFLEEQVFGQVLLIITAVGLTGYAFYRIYEAIKDPHNKGNDAKGIAVRTGYGASGLFYGFLAFTAVRTVANLGGSANSGSEGGNETVIAMLLEQTFGQILVGIVAAIFLGKSIVQFHKVYSGKYKKQVRSSGLDSRAREVMLKVGIAGYVARGIVIAIVAFLTFRAALTANSNEAGGTDDAFQFLQNEYGTVVLLVVAFGLLAYGLFMFVKARYSEMIIS